MVRFNQNHVGVVTFSPNWLVRPNLHVAAVYTWGSAALDGRPNGQVIINNDKWWWMLVSSIAVFYFHILDTDCLKRNQALGLQPAAFETFQVSSQRRRFIYRRFHGIVNNAIIGEMDAKHHGHLDKDVIYQPL